MHFRVWVGVQVTPAPVTGYSRSSSSSSSSSSSLPARVLRSAVRCGAVAVLCLPSSPLPSPPLSSGFCLSPCCCVVEVECFRAAHFLCVGIILLLQDRAQFLESFFRKALGNRWGFSRTRFATLQQNTRTHQSF